MTDERIEYLLGLLESSIPIMREDRDDLAKCLKEVLLFRKGIRKHITRIVKEDGVCVLGGDS